jgi:ribonuclease T1
MKLRIAFLSHFSRTYSLLAKVVFTLALFAMLGSIPLVSTPLGSITGSVVFSLAHAKESPKFSNQIAIKDLPSEAQDVLGQIKKGGPFRYKKDGATFSNRERLLPKQARGYYTEYTVKTARSKDRGAIRIVAGGNPQTSGEYYYTDDHYSSFKRIQE